jgi:long-chain acyl-CoA synthetase
VVTMAERPWLNQYRMGPYKLPHTKEPYPRVTVHSILDATAAEFPDKAACFYLGKEISYGGMKLLSDRLAAALADLGVEKGDRVATVLPNCPQFMISDFGIMKTGAAHVPCSVMHKAADLTYEIGESGAETVICTGMSLQTVNSIRGKTRIKNVIVTSVMDYSPEEPP